MKTFWSLLVLTGCFGAANAQSNYSAGLIPKELLSHANAVIRADDQTLEVKDIGNMYLHARRAVTILNSKGDDSGVLELYYDKDDQVKSIKGLIYNELGQQISKFNESDFSDESVADGYSLFNSERKKIYRPAVSQYPYTVVYDYEVRSKQTLNLGNWYPDPDEGESVEKSVFTFVCKPDFKVRYKETNLSNKPVIVTVGGKQQYTWEVDNLKAARYEPMSPYYRDIHASVQLAPEKFSYYGIAGLFTDWGTLGKWIYDKLLAGKQDLPLQTAEKIKELTKDISDPKLKAKKIYEYMQQKTHYVSVQVGLGGFQPFTASEVDQQNYGDCKALVNYTQALLNAAGIDSWYCVVKSGPRYKISMQNDFASMDQGDHIILCMPFKNDTTWVDCTSQTAPFGYLGDFTDDRTVLACTPQGGKLLHTPKYTADDDLKRRSATFSIDNGGALSGSMVTTFSGTEYDDREELVNEAFSEQNKILQKIYPINNMVIEAYNLKQEKSSKPLCIETIKLKAKDYASFTEGKYYFQIDPVNRLGEGPEQVINRHNDVYISRGFTHIDDVVYTIPDGYRLEKEPLNMSVSKTFGEFYATMEQKGNQLIYHRKLKLIDGTYGKDTYQDVVEFYQDIIDADGYTVTLVKK